jgi:predicted transport protein
MDKSTLTMLENLKEKTGQTLDEWKNLVQQHGFSKHGEILKFLKETHGITHGYATTIAYKILGSDAASVGDEDLLISEQYKGKEHMRAFYDLIIREVGKFGPEFEISPKKAYVSLRRKKQFVTLSPASKSRFEIGFNLKGVVASGKLQAEKPDAMCSHKISLTDLAEIDAEVVGWIRQAFEKAG